MKIYIDAPPKIWFSITIQDNLVWLKKKALRLRKTYHKTYLKNFRTAFRLFPAGQPAWLSSSALWQAPKAGKIEKIQNNDTTTTILIATTGTTNHRIGGISDLDRKRGDFWEWAGEYDLLDFDAISLVRYSQEDDHQCMLKLCTNRHGVREHIYIFPANLNSFIGSLRHLAKWLFIPIYTKVN